MTGGLGPIKAFSWKEIVRKCKLPSAERASVKLAEAWSLPLEQKKDIFDEAECNCLVFDNFSNILYAACGNDLIQRWDVDGGRGTKTSLKGCFYV